MSGDLKVGDSYHRGSGDLENDVAKVSVCCGMRLMRRVSVPLLLLLVIVPPSTPFHASVGLRVQQHTCRLPAIVLAVKKPAAKAKAAGAAGSGFGKAGSSLAVASGPTPEQLLKKAMQAYDDIDVLKNLQNKAEGEELLDGDEAAASPAAATDVEADSRISVTKYAVTIRSAAPDAREFCDWVPVALLAFACSGGANPNSVVPSAVGASVKEILEGGCQAFPSLRKVPRETIEYAFEPLDSFEKHVYEVSDRLAPRDAIEMPSRCQQRTPHAARRTPAARSGCPADA